MGSSRTGGEVHSKHLQGNFMSIGGDASNAAAVLRLRMDNGNFQCLWQQLHLPASCEWRSTAYKQLQTTPTASPASQSIMQMAPCCHRRPAAYQTGGAFLHCVGTPHTPARLARSIVTSSTADMLLRLRM